ncbi:serine hydrolase domain-containing protein [Amycolatopsis sp. H20-H5]|uniref:serine hydrolase domain-containing protein n=1 Tax=Amycolatopsis sp. H20-H5 TaxID=3046309 RepID=UPI002DBD2A8A|nr:serine hydrolase domain-containing protein [Amycolatopsis sp. H20-H5]MEC3981419.1 serine hydrolase domain-containing protein [Amycolatopsis sp. H20-H5]
MVGKPAWSPTARPGKLDSVNRFREENEQMDAHGRVVRFTVRITVAVAASSLLGVAAIGTASAGQRADQVRDAVRELVSPGGFPGAVAYFRTGGTTRRLGAGVADLATGEPATPGLRFRIASNTKSFVATVLLQLAGEGEVSLDDSIERWLPGTVRGPGYTPSEITLRMLLNHTSGLHDPDEAELFEPYFAGNRGYVYEPSEVIRRSLLTRPAFDPGQGVAYSNTGYLLLGQVIEKVTHHDVRAEIQRRLVRPLGLTRTSFPRHDPVLHGPHLHGYGMTGQDLTTFSPSYDWTAGAMVSTVDDLATFHRALLGGKLLKPAQQAELTRLVPNGQGYGGYGAGIETIDFGCPDGSTQTMWGNTGAGPGFYSVSMSSADGSRQLVLAANVFDLERESKGNPATMPRSTLPVGVAALCR